MNEQNLIILVSLVAIGLGLIIGYVWGFRNGAKDKQAESERTATKEARRRALIPAEDY